MGCEGTGPLTEFEYIASLRNREPDQCRGPRLGLAFSAWGLQTLEDSLCSEDAEELLWSGFEPVAGDRVVFILCAAHWMDLSYRSGVNGRTLGRPDWFSAGSNLLVHILAAAKWDPKEITNMVTWQRVQLT